MSFFHLYFIFFLLVLLFFFFFFFNDTATTEIYTLSLHDALPISLAAEPGNLSARDDDGGVALDRDRLAGPARSEEHTSELQSRQYLVCRLLLEKKKKTSKQPCSVDRKIEHEHIR